jgi:4-amino-4-deoxychorismate lyase
VATLWLVNGRETALDPADRGLQYGDGLFETMAASDGSIRWLDYHLARLADGCKRLSIPEPDWPTIRADIARHCPRSGRSVAKLIVTRGSGGRGYGPPRGAEPTRILSISAWPDYPRANYTEGVRVRTLDLRLAENAALAGLKHLCRLEQVLAHLELAAGDEDEGLLLGASGYVAGGTRSNVFAVRGTTLETPALTRCGVKGVMRRVVLETASLVELRAVERDLTVEDLCDADELFMTNALIGIWPIVKLDDRRFAPGPKTRALMRMVGLAFDA